MKAIGFTGFGGPEVLRAFEKAEPHPDHDEVRIRVHAATVNPADLRFREGITRPDADAKPPYIPGMEAAGEIDAIGTGVNNWMIGEKVFAIVMPRRPQGGAYAEQIVVPADSVAKIPAGVDYVHAATLPMNGLTAWSSLDLLALAAGQTIGVTGAAGAYGGYVVQLAKTRGLRSIVDAAESDEPLMSLLGADHVVRRGDDFAARMRKVVPEGVDGLADGALLHKKALPAIKDGGRIAVLRGWNGPSERGISIHHTAVWEFLRDRDKLAQLGQLAAEGLLITRVADTYVAEDAAIAHRRLARGQVRGRLVLEF